MNPSLLVIFTTPPSAEEYERADLRGDVVALSGEAAASGGAALRSAIAERRGMCIVADTTPHPDSATVACGLLSDCFLVAEGATLDLSDRDAFGDTAAGACWRIGWQALPLLGMSALSAADALAEGLVDGLLPGQSDPAVQVESWIGARSLHAMRSAAALLRNRAGSPGERLEFARLFATGEPQSGLRMFLSRQKPDFSEARRVEIV